MKIQLLALFFVASIFSAKAALASSCSERAVLAAKQLSTYDQSFEDLNKVTVGLDQNLKNVYWITLESGSSHYPNYFAYKVEVRNPEYQDSCLIIKVELDNVDGTKP